MTVRLGHYFSFIYLFLSPIYCTTDTPPSLLVNALSWTYLLTPRRRQDALRTVRLLSYLLHALPSPLLYYIRVHQYLLMCTLCAPFVSYFLTAALCIIAPFVHASLPANMCSTMPLVRVLVV